MNVLIYSKRNCTFCTKAKVLLDTKGIAYKETIIGEDMLREDFLEMFPNVTTVPLIYVDGQQIGGYNELREYIEQRPQYLEG